MALATLLPCAGTAMAHGDHGGTVVRADRQWWLDDVCRTVAQGRLSWRWDHMGDSPVTIHQRVTRVDRADGSSIVTITLTGDFDGARFVTSGSACVWLDTDDDGRLDRAEHARAYVARRAPVQVGPGGRRTIRFEVRVPGAAGTAICSRGYRADLVFRRSTSYAGWRAHVTQRTRWQWSYSNQSCAAPTDPESPTPPSEVPESSNTPMLAVTGATTGAVVLGAVGWRRRRRR